MPVSYPCICTNMHVLSIENNDVAKCIYGELVGGTDVLWGGCLEASNGVLMVIDLHKLIEISSSLDV